MRLEMPDRPMNAVEAFLCGNLFPPLLCLLVLIGHTFGVEYFTNIVLFAAVYATFLFCKTTKPMIVISITFLYQLSVRNSPSAPTSSDYLFTGWRLPGLFILGGLFLVTFAIYCIRTRFFEKIGFRKTPLLIPLLLFFVSQAVCGLCSGNLSIGNFAWGAGNAFTLLAMYLLFYVGMKDENPKWLTDYFATVSGWISLLLFAEVLLIYLTDPAILSNIGAIQKSKIFTGWAISNPIGASLAVLIPIDLYPALKKAKRRVPFAIVTALCAWAGACLTLSRNAILFGSLVLLISFLTLCVRSRYRKFMRVLLIVGIVGAAVAVAVFHEEIALKFKTVIDRGFKTSDRVALWGQAFDSFSSHPLFGVGFFNVVKQNSTFADFLPETAHNTLFELLGVSGLFGYGSYLWYRYETLKIAFRKMSLEKWMLFLSAATLLVEGLFDGFMFFVYFAFQYSAVIAILCLLDDAGKTPRTR